MLFINSAAHARASSHNLKERRQPFHRIQLLVRKFQGFLLISPDYIYTYKFIEVLTGPAPLFYLKHIPNQSLAFSDISPVELAWMSRLLLDPALNLCDKKKKQRHRSFSNKILD